MAKPDGGRRLTVWWVKEAVGKIVIRCAEVSFQRRALGVRGNGMVQDLGPQYNWWSHFPFAFCHFHVLIDAVSFWVFLSNYISCFNKIKQEKVF